MAKEKFEDSMNRLEEIVNILEKGDTDLDSSIKLFEEGLKLSEKLNLQLGEYEKKIESLVSDKENENE
ncbi:MAG: exodeoxyribonuclease VII small subunit [Erysipelotrichaceae bacterium]|nr:exodeoxyribonuclease VII small subunit [Bacillota bacterium]MDY3092464.1 exodeoxyribonuclease VII small subunit [Erysipelotrichaceae bacterium]